MMHAPFQDWMLLLMHAPFQDWTALPNSVTLKKTKAEKLRKKNENVTIA